MVLALLERWRPTLRVRNLSLQEEKRPDVKRLVASLLAEREGFEPSVPFLTRLFSRQVPSTTRAPLQQGQLYHNLNAAGRIYETTAHLLQYAESICDIDNPEEHLSGCCVKRKSIDGLHANDGGDMVHKIVRHGGVPKWLKGTVC